MGCINIVRREEEKKRAQDAYAARAAMLKEAGADNKTLERDTKLRQLKADIRKSGRRIRSITTTAEHVAKVKADKVAAAAAPKSKKDVPKEKKAAKPAKPKAPKKEA